MPTFTVLYIRLEDQMLLVSSRGLFYPYFPRGSLFAFFALLLFFSVLHRVQIQEDLSPILESVFTEIKYHDYISATGNFCC